MIRKDPLAHPEKLIRQVYAYVTYRIGAGPEAEDVTSETFEKALRYRSSYDPQKAAPIAWLLGIARRCADDGAADFDGALTVCLTATTACDTWCAA